MTRRRYNGDDVGSERKNGMRVDHIADSIALRTSEALGTEVNYVYHASEDVYQFDTEQSTFRVSAGFLDGEGISLDTAASIVLKKLKESQGVDDEPDAFVKLRNRVRDASPYDGSVESSARFYIPIVEYVDALKAKVKHLQTALEETIVNVEFEADALGNGVYDGLAWRVAFREAVEPARTALGRATEE
jgi:hypothetical protein